MINMNKVLVTGGAGYIGAILCERLLERGFQVHVLDKPVYQQNSLFHLCANPNFEFTYGDVLDEPLVRKLVKECDVIVPLAAIVGAPACKRDPLIAEPTNFNSILTPIKTMKRCYHSFVPQRRLP